jgi:hypothetical protein
VGKTAIVRDVVHASDGNASAYINCKTLEPWSMERLVADALKQLRSKREKGLFKVKPWETTAKTGNPEPAEDMSNPQDTQLLRSQPRRAAKVTVATLPTASSFKSSLDQPELGSSSQSPILSFGRGLQRLSKPVILIVDHAERLPDNALAELLLLPKVMAVRLRIVLISRYAILMGMRLDALASPEKSSATLANSIGGLTLLFPPYQDSAAIKEVWPNWM